MCHILPEYNESTIYSFQTDSIWIAEICVSFYCLSELLARPEGPAASKND